MVAALTLAARRLRSRGKSLRLVGLADRHRPVFSLAGGGTPDGEPDRRPRLLEAVGGRVFGAIGRGQRLLEFVRATAQACGAVIARRRPLPLGATVQQAAAAAVAKDPRPGEA